MNPASELVLGGQKSGKSRRAEQRAEAWLAASPGRRAVFIATAQPWDEEMRLRIERHRQDRAERLPRMATVEAPRRLAEAIAAHDHPHTLLVVDCLTLWLTNLMMPLHPESEEKVPEAQVIPGHVAMLLVAIGQARGPLVLVSNEIGLGVVPMGREVRAFVDMLGQTNQRVAAACRRVTLMAAGLPLVLKDDAP